ncbi:MAG: UvrD-helicase domain-containing protein [Bacteroidaceae bacterium]|nr:UvrD-helicase domain-containing protein [Bacteroidaceae bacterium]
MNYELFFVPLYEIIHFMEQSLTIYKASAGSGKTFALAVEYILQLLMPNAEHEFEHTLAVTFTNKATAEMKSRILETLYGLKHNLQETQPYMDAILKRLNENGTPLSISQINTGAGKALTAILHDYSHFRVETIDSFFQSILRNMARELGLAANLQVELSHDEVIASAVDSLIETMDSKPEVEQWVMDYIHEQIESGDKWDIIGPLKEFAGNIFREEYQQRDEKELKRISDTNIVNGFKRKMQALRKNAEQDVQQAVDDLISQIENSPLTFDKIYQGKSLKKFLLEAREMKSDGPSASTLAQVNGEKPFPLAAYKNNPDCLTAAEALQTTLRNLIDFYTAQRKIYLSATLALRHLGPLRLLVYIDERAREIEGDAGRFTLSSTPALLSKMIEGSDAPFIFEKIGTFINYVMIDEFQDTSRMQWENFKKLLFEKLASGGKGLLVGDIKQSIYRWRNGDWKILHGIENESELQRFHIQPKPLDINYRSHQTIIDFNNAFFPPAAVLLDAISPNEDIKLSELYADVEQKKKKEDGKGYVRVVLTKVSDDYIKDTVCDMAEQIRELQAGGLELSEIAILIRTNAMAQQLIEGFSQYAPDIRLVSDEAFLLEASISIQMIVAALRLLIDKHHTDGISEKYLMLHYQQDVLGKTDTTLQHIALQEAKQVLPEEFIAHQEELLQLPLYLLAERLWRIFSLGNIPGEDVYVLTFLDELQNHLRSAGAPDIQTFLTAWDEKLRLRSIPGSEVDGVHILTIHKSKGLEFHTVLLPFSHWQIESDRQGDVLWCDTDIVPYNELGALPISTYSRDVRSSVFAPDYEREHLERRVDALDTLYVAFTRAAANLYVWGKTKPFDKIKNITTAADLIYMTLRNDENDTNEECFTYEVGQTQFKIQNSKSEEEEGINRLSILHRMSDAVEVKVATRNPMLYFLQSNQTQDYLQQMKNEELRTKNKSNSDSSLLKLSQREVGKRMHEVLSRINDVSQFDTVFYQARQEGIIGEGKDWDTIITRVTEGFRNPLVASWFNQKNTVYNECAVASKDNETGQVCVLRPDRVVMKDRCITVIDYKFGHPSRHYYDQVAAYMELMHRMYPEHEVKGYLWYIMGKGPVPVKLNV